MICRICILMILFGWSPVWAQEVTLRTGWHPTFTRVVLAIDTDAAWRVGRTDRGIGVEVAGAEGFDVSGFFTRLPRQRITDVLVDRDILEFSLGCICHATAYLWRPDRLVVDIRDGAGNPDSPYEMALAPDPTPGFAPLELLPRSRLTLDDISPLRALTAAPDPTPAAPNLTDLESAIVSSLSRAADQGLLDFADVPSAREDAGKMAAPGPDPAKEMPPDIAAEPVAPGVRTRSSVDVGLSLQSIEDALVGAGGVTCWPDDFVAVADWGTDAGFAAETGAGRTALFGEFDRLDPDAVLQLARTYAYYGFGREARETLNLDGNVSPERVAIDALARLIDDEEDAHASLAQQRVCPGDVALWGLIAAPPSVSGVMPDPQRLVRQFRSLPDHLQEVLAARLGRRLMAMGEQDFAELVLAPDAETSAPSVAAELLTADLARGRGDVAAANATLTSLAQNDSRATPEALITLLDLQIAEGLAIDPSHIDLLKAYRFEFRHAPIDLDLGLVEARAQIATAQHLAAIETLRALAEDHPATDLTAAFADAMQAAAVGAEDVDFLALAYADEGARQPGPVGNEIARRLIDLGFADRAEDVLSTSATGEAMAERRYLRAEAAIVLGKPERAEAALAGISTDRARRILDAYVPVGPSEADPSSTAWRRGDWAGLSRDEDPELRAASALVLRDVTPPDPARPLAEGRSLIERAEETRATISGLLNRFEAPTLP